MNKRYLRRKIENRFLLKNRENTITDIILKKKCIFVKHLEKLKMILGIDDSTAQSKNCQKQ